LLFICIEVLENAKQFELAADDDDSNDAAAADASGLRRYQRTAVDELTDEFRMKMTAPGALTKPLTKPKQKVYLCEDSSTADIIHWLSMKGFSYRYMGTFAPFFKLLFVCSNISMLYLFSL